MKEAMAGLAVVVPEIVTGGNPPTHARKAAEDGLVVKVIRSVVTFMFVCVRVYDTG